MKLVSQEHGMGCGVACVASLLGIRYRDALRLFRYQKNAGVRGYTGRDICYALKKSGKVYWCRYVGKKKCNFKNKVIVYVKKNKKYSRGHYLLRTPRGWMNPWMNVSCKPIKAGYCARLPGRATYVISECDYREL